MKIIMVTNYGGASWVVGSVGDEEDLDAAVAQTLSQFPNYSRKSLRVESLSCYHFDGVRPTPNLELSTIYRVVDRGRQLQAPEPYLPPGMRRTPVEP